MYTIVETGLHVFILSTCSAAGILPLNWSVSDALVEEPKLYGNEATVLVKYTHVQLPASAFVHKWHAYRAQNGEKVWEMINYNRC